MAGRPLFVPLVVMLVATAWAALLTLQQTPYGAYLDHDRLAHVGFAAALCGALPNGNVVLPLLLYGGGWVIMSAAMMLPTSLPLVGLFERVVAGRSDRVRLLALLLAGYIAAWSAFGFAAHVLDSALHAAAIAWQWLLFNSWAVGAAGLSVAGAFQFSALKRRCLERCRTPFSFIAMHWRGVAPGRAAFRLGFAHGVFCVGCCWAIMLLMVVEGTASVAGMLLLGAIMAVEKNVSWGRRLTAPLGVGLLASSLLVVAEHAPW